MYDLRITLTNFYAREQQISIFRLKGFIQWSSGLDEREICYVTAGQSRLHF